MSKIYAVKVGRKKGIYYDWVECFKNISGYKNAVFKKFSNLEEAQQFLNNEIQENKNKNLNNINVYTDGSCINNGKKTARAGIGIYFGENDKRNISAKYKDNPSNQRAELYAIIVAIKLLNPEEIKKSVIIHTDSMYSINCVTKWYSTWKRHNWVTSKKKPVKNLKLIKELYDLIHTYNINLKHIRSHTNKKDVHSIGNQKADHLALRGALS